MKHERILTVLLLGVTLVMASSVAHADWDEDSHDKGSMKKMEERRDHMCKELGLNEEQKKSLDANRKAEHAQMMALQKEKKEKKEMLRAELQKEQLDEAKVAQINEELKQLQSKIQDQRLTGIMSVRKILTPQQFKKFSEKMDKHKGEMRGKHKGHKDDEDGE